MSIFEYDQEKELKLIREAEREEGLEKGLERGRIEGLIQIIRKKVEKKLSVQEISDLLETDYDYVSAVVSLIEEQPDLKDNEVATILINKL